MTSEEQNKRVLSALVSTIRGATKLSTQDIAFYRSLDRSLTQSADNCSDRLLNLVNRIVNTVSPGEVDTLGNSQDIENNWNDISNVIDTLFEKTDIALDLLRKSKSLTKRENDADRISNSTNSNTEQMRTVEGASSDKVIHHSKTLSKPQLSFRHPVNNSKDIPFKPLLTSKPHAIVPYEDSIKLTVASEEDEEDNGASIDGDINGEADIGRVLKNNLPYYIQPYGREITQQSYPNMLVKDPIPSTDWDSTVPIYVDNEEKLLAMLEDLKQSSEIAVDLEHHDYRSYYGIVCLMQISNREKDWIVDTLVLRNELQVLNEVFTDPNIIKVLHGAYMDIMWLQRDFGLYIVSLFDTFAASKALGFPRHGLAYLLETYAKFLTSKKYQLADWRIRPLPTQMQSYARADTHFLLNIFDILRNRLINSDKLHIVLEESRQVASQRYENPGYATTTVEACLPILLKYRLTPSQQVVLRDLYEWRDQAARKADESTRFIMPNHFLVALSVTMPTTVAGILSVSNGATAHVRAASVEIAKIITKAKVKISDEEDGLFKIEREGEAHQDEELKEKIGEGALDYVESDYKEYRAKFEAAIEWQKHLFDPTNIQEAVSRLRGAKSEIFSCLITTTTVDQETYSVRAELIRDKLELYVPVPPDMEEEASGGDDKEYTPSSQGAEESQLQADEMPVNKDDSNEDALELDDSDGIFETSETVKRKAESQEEGEEEAETALTSKKKRKQKRRKLKVVDQSGIKDHDPEGDRQDNGDSPPQPFPDVPFNAFDFKSAAPVLSSKQQNDDKKRHKNKNQKGDNRKSGGNSEVFDPYSKTPDVTPKGARKISRPAGGHTFTYKTKR